MKKILSLCLVALVVVFLAGCNSTTTTTIATTADTTQPVMTGTDNVSINVGDTFDPLSGVSATDDIDGNITSSIVVSGTVDTTTAGVYKIKYSVQDAAGNLYQVFRNVTVVFVAEPSNDIIVNGDFSQGTNGWTVGAAEGGDGTLSVTDDGALKLTMVSEGWTQPFPRVDSSLFALEQGKTYEVSFQAKADVARAFHVQVGELFTAAPWFNKLDQDPGYFALTTTMSDFSYKFTMTQADNANVKLLFEFGTMNNSSDLTNIYLDNIAITETTADPDVTAPVFAGVDDATISTNSTFDALDGVTCTDGIDGAITLTANNVSGTVNTAVAGVYTLTYTAEDAASNLATATRVITVKDLVLTDTMKIVNGDFASTDLNWEVIANDGAAFTIDAATGALVVNITSTGANAWSSQISYNDVTFEKGQTYTISFDAQATVARNVKLSVGWTDVANGYAWNSFLGSVESTFALTTDSQNYSLTFTMNNDTYFNTSVKFEFGQGDANVLTFDNVKIQELTASHDSIPNSATNGWFPFSNTNDAIFTTTNGVATYQVLTLGGDNWSNQLIANKFTLINGHDYTLTFQANSSVARTIEAKVEEAGTYVVQGDQVSNITTENATYTLTFTANKDSANMQMEFLLGSIPGTDSVNVLSTLTFDNVNLVDTTAADGLNLITNGTFDLILN